MAVKYPSYSDKVLFVDLMQGQTGPTDPATQSNLDAWVKSNHTNYASFKSPDDTPLAIHDALGGVRKTLYVVEWQTMKILNKTFQNDAATFTFLDSL
jgi:hypothetical protein